MTQIPLQSRFKQDFFRFRYGTGSYTAGRYTDGTVSVAAYKGSIQPMVGLKGGEQLQNIPEGMRTRKWIVCYTYPNTLRTASEKPNNTKADLIYFGGETFEVQKVNRWTGQILTHDEVWAVEHDASIDYPGEVPSSASSVASNGTTVRISGLGAFLSWSGSTGLVVLRNGVAAAYTGASITGTYADGIALTLTSAVDLNDVITFTYDADTGSLTSALTGIVADASGSIPNNSTVPQA